MRSFLLVVLFAASALGQNQQPPAPASPPPASTQGAAVSQDSAAQPAKTDAVLAEVGDYKLTETELATIVRMIGPQQAKGISRQELIKRWMSVVVFSEEAKASGADKDPEFLRVVEIYKRQALFGSYQRNLLADYKPVTPEEALKFYEENKKQFERPATVKIGRILTATKEKADAANAALRAGQSFEEVAKAHSIDGASKDKGGDIGWINAGVTEPAFDQVAFSLGVNQVSEPFATKLGWQIVKVTDKKDAVQIPFPQVQERLSQQLNIKKQQELIEAKAAELFQKYNVKIEGENQGESKPANK